MNKQTNDNAYEFYQSETMDRQRMILFNTMTVCIKQIITMHNDNKNCHSFIRSNKSKA